MRGLLLLFLLVASAATVNAADPADYERDIKPLFAEKCAACHGTLKQEAGLRLDAGLLILKGSDGGEVLTPGKSSESLVVERVAAEDPAERMPPEGEGESLNAEQIALVKAWIDGGAAVPDDEAIPEDPRKHWAYQLPVRPALPDFHGPAWSHPIDRFIAAGYVQQGLAPVHMADRYTLLRRAYLDLIGLPPTPEQLRGFVEDDSGDAWATVVDELLASPHYGERWGRHWMDVWRYSDWDGFKQQLRGSQRHIWRWRDWIVQSLNDGKGYDRMIVEMLAGDELAPGDPSILPATGFLARNFHSSNRNIWLDATVEHTAKAFLGMTLNCARCHDHKYDPLAQTEYYRFRAIFEPHNVRTDRLPGQRNVLTDGLPRVFDKDLVAKTFLYIGGDDRNPDEEHPLEPAVPEVLGGTFDVQPVELPVEAFFPAVKGYIAKEDLTVARAQLNAAAKQLATARSNSKQIGKAGDGESADEKTAGNEKSVDGAKTPEKIERPDVGLLKLKHAVARLRVKSLEARQAADRAKYVESDEAVSEKKQEKLSIAAARSERKFKLREAELAVTEKKSGLIAAEWDKNEDEAARKAALEAAKTALADAEKTLAKVYEASEDGDGNASYTPSGEEYPHTSTGRRLALARWIASADNPLTARVAVNHLWLRHFGAPLVENVFDFGLRSPRPAHADLLDWLAVELMENDWNLKHIQRLIVTSRTWQLDSSADSPSAGSSMAANERIDRDNHYLWRANVRRLDAEIVRDNVLAVSGGLDTTLGGPDIDFNDGETSHRRSIYIRHAYEKQMTMLVLFDAASPNECYRRSESIIPQQALALANSSLTLGQSRLLARQLWDQVAEGSGSDNVEFIQAAFLQLLSRPPADEELAACQEFLVDQAAVLADPTTLTRFVGGEAPEIEPAADAQDRARENLVHVLMNHNDFVSVR